MADEKDELSDEEYDALLRDLTGRSDSGASAGGDEGGEDIEDIDAFLRDIEAQSGDDTGGTTTATRDADDDLAREFAALQEKGELTAPEKEEPKKSSKEAKKKVKKARKDRKKKARREKKAGESEDQQGGEGERSRGAEVAIKAAVVAAWSVPAVIFWWLLGTYLGTWISAAWLIGLVGAGFVFGTPLVLKKAVKRGEYRYWMLGLSLVATVALIAPMPNVAGSQMSHYGHWPASVVAEITGASADSGLVRAQASATGWLGSLVATAEEPNWEARQLGTIFPLGMQWPPDEETMELLEEGLRSGEEGVEPAEQGQEETIEQVEPGDEEGAGVDEEPEAGEL